MDVRIENDTLVIRIPVNPAAISNAPLSSTGKTKLVASTKGTIPVAVVNGASLSLGLNLMAK